VSRPTSRCSNDTGCFEDKIQSGLLRVMMCFLKLRLRCSSHRAAWWICRTGRNPPQSRCRAGDSADLLICSSRPSCAKDGNVVLTCSMASANGRAAETGWCGTPRRNEIGAIHIALSSRASSMLRVMVEDFVHPFRRGRRKFRPRSITVDAEDQARRFSSGCPKRRSNGDLRDFLKEFHSAGT